MIGSRRRIKACFQRFRMKKKLPTTRSNAFMRPSDSISRPKPGGNRFVDSRRSNKDSARRQSRVAVGPLIAIQVASFAHMTGAIFSDLGQASRFMALEWVQELFKQCLGYQPFSRNLEFATGNAGRCPGLARECNANWPE
jgi:hypothetical protein